MIDKIFASLSAAFQSTPLAGLGAAFLWGILSILLSPCHLASIPLIVGFIGDQDNLTAGKAFILSLLFSTGILITIAIIGVITASMGRMLGDIGSWGNYFVAVIFFVVGAHLVGLIPLPWAGRGSQPQMKKRGFSAAFLLGLLFGIALGPCTFAYMAPIIAITFSLATAQKLYGIALLAIYGIGHCSVIVMAGTFTEVVERYLKWNERSKGADIIRKICGILVIIAGIYLIFTSH